MLPPGMEDQGPMGQPPGMTPPMPAQPAAGLSGLFSMMSELAQKPKETPADKVKRILSMMDEVRQEDDKIGENISMAMHVIKNGSSGLEKFGAPSAPDNPRRSR